MAYIEDDGYSAYIKDGYSTSNMFTDCHELVLEIPDNKLLQHNAGDLSKLDQNNADTILSYLMKEPSPFNSIVPDLKRNAQLLKQALLFWFSPRPLFDPFTGLRRRPLLVGVPLLLPTYIRSNFRNWHSGEECIFLMGLGKRRYRL